MQTGMNIGTVVDKDSLGALTDSLVRLMEARADQETIRAAFDALTRMARVEHCTIQNCVINGDRKVEVKIDGENADARVSYDDPAFGYTGMEIG